MGDRFDKILELSNSSQLAQMANKIISWDFLLSAIGGDFAARQVNSGTLAGEGGTSKHPGIAILKSSTSANSGYGAGTAQFAFLIAGNEEFVVILKTGTLTNTTIRSGFSSSTSEVAPTYGAYINIEGTTLTGKTINGAAVSTTATSLTIAEGTWYKLKVKINSNGTSAIFEVFSDDDVLLWSDTLNEKVPVSSTVGASIIATNSGTSVLSLAYVDFISCAIPNSRSVV